MKCSLPLASGAVETAVRRYAIVVLFREPAFDAQGTLVDRPRISVVETLATTGSDATRSALRAFQSMDVEFTESICLEGEGR